MREALNVTLLFYLRFIKVELLSIGEKPILILIEENGVDYTILITECLLGVIFGLLYLHFFTYLFTPSLCYDKMKINSKSDTPNGNFDE